MQTEKNAFRTKSCIFGRRGAAPLVILIHNTTRKQNAWKIIEGKEIKHAEAFELCEYGSKPKKEQLLKLFPFFAEAGE